MDEGLKALLQVILLLVFAVFCVFMAVRTMRRNKAKKAAEYEAEMLKLRQEGEARIAAQKTIADHQRAIVEDKKLMAQLRKEAEKRLEAHTGKK